MQSDKLFFILNDEMKQNVLSALVLVCNLFTVYGNCFRWDSSTREYCKLFDLKEINKIFTKLSYIGLYRELVEDDFSNTINNGIFLLTNIFIEFSIKIEDKLFEKIKEDKRTGLFSLFSQSQNELLYFLTR